MNRQYNSTKFLNQDVVKWSSLYLTTYYTIRYIGKQYKIDNPAEISSAITSNLHHTIVFVSNLRLIKPYFNKIRNGKLAEFEEKDKEYVINITQKDCNNTVAYLLIDLIPNLFHFKTYDWSLILHHCVYPYLMHYITKTGFNNLIVLAHIFEFASLFNNLHIIFKTFKQDKLASICQLLFGILFLLTRLPLGWIENYLTLKNSDEINSKTKDNYKAKINYYGLIIFSNILNHYWVYLIVMKIIHRLRLKIT
jgi:hypothetical protein